MNELFLFCMYSGTLELDNIFILSDGIDLWRGCCVGCLVVVDFLLSFSPLSTNAVLYCLYGFLFLVCKMPRSANKQLS
jgi:hypothetical protein